MKKNWLLSGIVGAIAAIACFASMANYAFPGEGAHLMAIWRGLVSPSGASYPLLAAFARIFGGGNVISPICGVIACVTIFHLVATFISWRVIGEHVAHNRNRLARIAGFVASLVFLFSPAVRSAATHLSPRMFDFTWALLTLALAIPFFRASKGLAWAYPPALGAMAALGFCDSALFAVFVPFFVVLVVLHAKAFDKKPYMPVLLFVLSAAIVFFAALPCFGLSFLDVATRTSAELKSYRAHQGWLFVALFTTLPFLVALFSSGKAFSEKPGLVPWIFHGAMTFVVILSVATPLSPSSLMEPYGVEPVVTCAFAAAVAGYLIAFWWSNRRHVAGVVAGGALTFVLVVMVFWNLFSFDGDAGAFADKVARKIVADMGTRSWLVTDGSLDDHLALVAQADGKKLNLISLSRDLDQDYLDELALLVERENVGGSKNGALRLSLSLGVLPFVQDWFATDPSVTKDVAIFGAPDLWYSAGLKPVPEFLFFGADEKIVPDWSAWKEFDAILKAPKGWGSYRGLEVSNPVELLRLSLRRHLGFVANNRGVYLQDQKDDDGAFEMYELVLNEIDRDNICSIFNEVAMVDQKYGKAMAKRKELERMLNAIVEDKARRYLLWRLGTYYGYIRSPDSFIRLGHAWARSGRPGDALSQIRRAIDFVPTDKRSILLNMMASLYASGNDQKKSRDIYESILAKDATNHDALIGMMRLALLDGNSAKALEYLERASKSTTDGQQARMELAMIAMMKSDLAEAKSILKKATDFDSKDMQAWSLLAAVTMQQLDAAKSEKERNAILNELENDIVPSMEKRTTDQHDYYLQATKGFVMMRQGAEKRREARDAFVAAAKVRPDVAATQDMVLGLDISMDDKANAEIHAKEVLRRNRNAPLANYVMGSIALGRGKYVEAESYLRRAADAPQPVPLALNDLAEVLRRNKNFAEAERYARKATEKAPGLYVAWETLGSILIDSEKNLDEAEACIRKACSLSKDKNGNETDVRMLISLARVQVRRGDLQHAKVTIRRVRSRIGELSEFERREFENAVKDVR